MPLADSEVNLVSGQEQIFPRDLRLDSEFFVNKEQINLYLKAANSGHLPQAVV